LNNLLKFRNFCRTFNNNRGEWPVSKHSGQAWSKGRAVWCLVYKQNLNPSYWHIKNCWKLIQIENVIAPQSCGGQELKKISHRTLQSRFLNIQKIRCMLLCRNYSFEMICKTEGGVPI
jgi:hypothetical protein